MSAADRHLRAALAYAQRFGFPVFPCKPRTKEPQMPNGFQDATTDETIIRAWWSQTPDANIGLLFALAVATGRPWLNRLKTRQGSVLLVLEEEDRSAVLERLDALYAGLGFSQEVGVRCPSMCSSSKASRWLPDGRDPDACPSCDKVNWWLKGSGQWVCSICHPKPVTRREHPTGGPNHDHASPGS